MNMLATIPAQLTTLLSDSSETYTTVQNFVLSVMVFSIIAGIVWKIRSRTGK